MIPIYRAKKIDSDEYIIGYLEEHNTNDFYISLMPNEIDSYKIDTSTLSIHFPDMLDIKGNKIFASLQEDGKGGDILEFSSNYFGDYTTVLYFKNHRLITHSKTIKDNTIRNKESLSSSKVIGIQ